MNCTHIALQVRSIARSVAFYQRFCGLRVVHSRGPDSSPVAWLGWGEDPPVFVIVLLEGEYDCNIQPQWQHIGMAVENREAVDSIYARAEADGIKKLWRPRDGGPIVGYFCGVSDPDGNMVEFSHGQRIG